MQRKYLWLSLFIGPFPLLVLVVFLTVFYPTLMSKSTRARANIDIIQHKIDGFKKYEMSSEDFNFLQRFPKTLRSGNELIVAHLNLIRKIIYFVLIISLIQAVSIVDIYRRKKVK